MYLFMLILIYKQYGWKGTLIILVAVVLMITATDQLKMYLNTVPNVRDLVRKLRMTDVMVCSRAPRTLRIFFTCGGSMAAAIF